MGKCIFVYRGMRRELKKLQSILFCILYLLHQAKQQYSICLIVSRSICEHPSVNIELDYRGMLCETVLFETEEDCHLVATHMIV